jgi:pSer/pThr/pTyr-binding forkhead associated (FHA) protein
MATLPHTREILRIEECPAEKFDEAYLHVTKGLGISNGYFSYPHGALTRYLLLRGGELLCAAWDDGEGGKATPLRDFFEPFQHGSKFLTFQEADEQLIEVMAASWQLNPDAHSSPGLIDPNMVIRALVKSGRRIAVRLRREQLYSFAALDSGMVRAFYSSDSRSGVQPSDAMAAALAVRPEELSVDVFENPQAARSEDWALPPANFQEGMVRFYSSTAPHLLLLLGDRELKRIPLKAGRTSIGRDPTNDVVIDNLSVSRKHAEVSFMDGVCTVTDLGSSNGTLMYGKRINGQVRMEDGQEVVIGKHTVRFLSRAARQEKAASGVGLDQTIFMRMPAMASTSLGPEPVLTVGGQSVPVRTTPFIIGADPTCDLPLQGKGIRPKHAIIKQDAGGQHWISHEAGVLSATRINGQKVRVAPLQSGDLLQLGSILLRFHWKE